MRFFIIVVLAFLVSSKLAAQGRLKGGLGVNYISNEYEQPHLYDYFGPSLNLSYTFFRKPLFGLAIENATSLRLSGVASDANYKSGFTTSFPLYNVIFPGPLPT